MLCACNPVFNGFYKVETEMEVFYNKNVKIRNIPKNPIIGILYWTLVSCSFHCLFTPATMVS